MRPLMLAHLSRRARALALALATLWATTGCGKAEGHGAARGQLVVAVTALTSAAQVTRVTVTIAPASVTQDLTYNAADGTFTGTIDVAPGAQTVTVSAYAGTSLVGTGSASAAVAIGAVVQVAITVLDATGPPPQPGHSPVITSFVLPATASVGDQVAVAATATAAGAVSYAWTVSPAACGAFADAAAASTTFGAASATTCTVQLVASAEGLATSRSAQVTVTGPAPTLTVSPNPASVALGGTQAFTVSPAVAVTWSVDESQAGVVPDLDATTYAYPLRKSSDGRYLVDQNGKPFRIQGEAAWSLIANLTLTEATTYLENRRLKGFNLVMVNLLEHFYSSNPPANAAGQLPFVGGNDFGAMNEAYFAFADSVIRLAASKGIAVLLAPAYLGNNGGLEGWAAEMAAAGTAKCTGYGTYVGNRYKTFSNVLWLEGGDWTPTGGAATCAKAIMDGIVAAGAPQPQSGHWTQESASTDVAAFAPSLSVNGVYTYNVPYTRCATAYAQSKVPTLPTFLLETGYENERTGTIRESAWWAILGGCTEGYVFGNRPIWLFDRAATKPTWQQAMDGRGSLEMSYLRRALEPLPWQDLAPSTAVITAGRSSPGNGDYVTAALASTGRLLVAYLPAGGAASRSITVNMGLLSVPVRARWFDPAGGTYRDVAGAQPFANSGARTFQAPGVNSAGANDWVLILDQVGGGAACGTIGATGVYQAPALLPSPATCHVTATQQSDASATAHATVTLH